MTWRLMLDPGHGGTDRGAVAHAVDGTEFVEADYVWGLAEFLHHRVGHSGEPFEVALTRELDDGTVSQSVRGARSSHFRADLVLSLHVNAGPSNLHGAMAFYWPGNGVGQEVADAILRAYPPPLLRRAGEVILPAIAATDDPTPGDDWLRRARGVVGSHLCPVVLVEVGYLSHPADLAALQHPPTQSAIIAALMCGVARFRQLSGTPMTPPVVDRPPEVVAAKAEIVKRQFREAKGASPHITCECGLRMPLRFAYRCYYCGEFYCDPCASSHFGKRKTECPSSPWLPGTSAESP